MKILSQRNPVWAGDNIGKTNQKIGKVGCTITCISMLSDYFGSFRTPAWFADNLKFTKEALLYWTSVNTQKELKFTWTFRGYGQDWNKIDSALKDPNTAVILEVEHYHWVVALSRIPFTRIYRIADPWTGTKRLSSAYKYISGFSTFKRK